MGDIAVEGIPGKEGMWQITDLNRLRRFLCFGDETGCYKVDLEKERDRKKTIGLENAKCVMRLLETGHGPKVIEEIVKFSADGRAAKSKPALFALAMCVRLSSDLQTRQNAYRVLPQVCRTPTQLFTFVTYSEKLADKKTGWGTGQRKAISRWYNEKEALRLAMLVTKYIQRNGWSHVDVLRLSHVKPKNDMIATVLMYVTKGFSKTKEQYEKSEPSDGLKAVLAYLEAVHELKHTKDEQQAARLIESHQLVMEHVPTWFSESAEVWRALLPHMPLGALIKNLVKLSTLKILDSDSNSCVPLVVEKLKDKEKLQQSRLHPFSVLLALETYRNSATKGKKDKKKWVPNNSIIDALDEAFYATFKNVPATGKRFLLAVDVSKSMRYGGVNGSMSILPAMATLAMAMLTFRTETQCKVLAFSEKIFDLEVKREMKLQDVMKVIAELPAGGTDCGKPIEWALDNKESFDVFIIYTDCGPSETRPAELLRTYRKSMGILNAKMVVCALSSTGFSVADPEDCGMLDVCGFDTATPDIISSFVMGQL